MLLKSNRFHTTILVLKHFIKMAFGFIFLCEAVIKAHFLQRNKFLNAENKCPFWWLSLSSNFASTKARYFQQEVSQTFMPKWWIVFYSLLYKLAWDPVSASKLQVFRKWNIVEVGSLQKPSYSAWLHSTRKLETVCSRWSLLVIHEL